MEEDKKVKTTGRSLFKLVCWKASLRSHQVIWDFIAEKESAMDSEEKSVPDKENDTFEDIKLDKDWVSEKLKWKQRGWIAESKGEGDAGAIEKDSGPLPTRMRALYFVFSVKIGN